MKNLATDEELGCTVMDVNASASRVPEAGVAFSELNPHVWRVSFPPADWTPRSPAARRHGNETVIPVASLAKK